MLGILGQGWEAELVVRTGTKGNGIPSNYKIDIGNRQLMIGVELDGQTHSSPTKRSLDKKKDSLLATFGWTIYRMKNEEALKMCSICTSAGTLLTLLKAS
jgi:very-short-patch-repair endonuclease